MAPLLAPFSCILIYMYPSSCVLMTHDCAQHLPEEMVADTPYGLTRDSAGVAVKIEWKPFYSNLPPPMLRGPGGFGKLPPLRKAAVASPTSITEEPSGFLEPPPPRPPVEDGPAEEDVECVERMRARARRCRPRSAIACTRTHHLYLHKPSA